MFKQKLNTLIVLSLLFFLTNCEESNEDVSTFIKFFGTEYFNSGTDVLELNNEFYLLSTIDSADVSSISITKTDKYGNQLWQKTYGDTLNQRAVKFIKSNNNTLIVLANEEVDKDEEDYDINLAEITTEGEVVWKQKFTYKYRQEAADVIISSNNEFIITGYTNELNIINGNLLGIKDILVMRIDVEGKLIWRRRYGGALDDYAARIIEKEDENLVIIGTTLSFPKEELVKYNATIFEINSKGYLLDQMTYGTPSDDYGLDGFIDDKKNIVFISKTINNEKSTLVLNKVSVTDIHTSILEQKIMKEKNLDPIRICYHNNSYFIIGSLENEDKDTDIFLVISDKTGNNAILEQYGSQWQETPGALIITSDNKMAIIGSSGNEYTEMITLIKVNETGNF